jgi:hypothetical protein
MKKQKTPLLPGKQTLSAKDFKVDMLHLDIAEQNISEGRLSMSNGEPLEVSFNITTGEARLCNGYHRYLQERGGTVSNAVELSKQGIFPDFFVDVSLVKNEPKSTFGYVEVQLTASEKAEYLSDFFGTKETRALRAKEQGFDADKVFFHGTTPQIGCEEKGSDLHSFSPDFVGTKWGQDREGYFFHNNPSEASIYASIDAIGKRVDGGSVYPVNLKMENPLIVDADFCEKNGLANISDEGVISFWDNNHLEVLSLKGKSDSILLVDGKDEMPVIFDASKIRSVFSSFHPNGVGNDDILGHRYKHPSPPKKAKVYALTPKEELFLPRITEIIENANLSVVNKIKSVLSLVAPPTDFEKASRLSFLAHMNSKEYTGASKEDRAKSIALLLTAASLKSNDTSQPKLDDESERLRPRA